MSTILLAWEVGSNKKLIIFWKSDFFFEHDEFV